jgi:elongation factor Ts
MATTVELIKQLREETKAGVLNCRMALEQANGSYTEALEILRAQAAAEAAHRANRQASQGRIELYSHGDGRIGVMVEINTETDFAARSEITRHLAREIALQIAAANPRFVRDEDIPEHVIAEETLKASDRARDAGKPETLIARIVDGYLKKFKDTQVLLRQTYIRDDQLTVAELLSQAASSIGENIIIRRFERWEMVEPEVT